MCEMHNGFVAIVREKEKKLVHASYYSSKRLQKENEILQRGASMGGQRAATRPLDGDGDMGSDGSAAAAARQEKR